MFRPTHHSTSPQWPNLCPGAAGPTSSTSLVVRRGPSPMARSMFSTWICLLSKFPVAPERMRCQHMVRRLLSYINTHLTTYHSPLDSYLADELTSLATTFPNLIIIYTGSSASTNHKRQATPLPPVRPALVNINAPANTTLPEGGILKRYQLLTPGLITSLLVTLFILLPLVMLGFSALASIQSPLRVEAPKNYSASERKTQ